MTTMLMLLWFVRGVLVAILLALWVYVWLLIRYEKGLKRERMPMLVNLVVATVMLVSSVLSGLSHSTGYEYTDIDGAKCVTYQQDGQNSIMCNWQNQPVQAKR